MDYSDFRKKTLRGTTGNPDNAMGSHGEPWGTSKKVKNTMGNQWETRK